MASIFCNCNSGIVSNCGCNHNIYQFDWKIAYDNVTGQLEKLRAENAELKAKLEKKRIPPRGAPVISDKGVVGYSSGEFGGFDQLKVYQSNSLTGSILYFFNWEEIEIKVKE